MKKILSAAIGVLCVGTALAQSPYLVSDINTSYAPNAVSSIPRSFTPVGSTVVFSASNDANGFELFRTDGTTVELVKDIVPGTGGSISSGIIPLSPTIVIFAANDQLNGAELWKSDGTDAGTVLVKDINIGGQSSGVLPMAAMDGRVFFLASNTSQPRVVWVTDGSESGTKKLVDAPEASGFAVLNNIMYFYSGTTLWRSDGTPEGTTAVRTDLTIKAMTSSNGHLFLAAWDAAHGYELWISDGTSGGTLLLKDINPGAAGAFNTNYEVSFATTGSLLVFFAYDAVNGWSLWRSDGTTNGTFSYKTYPWPSSAVPPSIRSAGGLVFFSLAALWRTDGTDQGTFVLGTTTDSFDFTTAGSNVFFVGRQAQGPYRLWTTDGTDGGTSMVSALAQPASLFSIAWINGNLYFSGSDGVTGSEPWISDGTEDGTHLIANLASDPPASSNPDLLRGALNRVFFTATTGSPAELWTSDGTSGGTLSLTNFAGSKTFSSSSAWKDSLFFLMTDQYSYMSSLYFSDGTPAGTSQLKNMAAYGFFPGSNYFFFAGPPETSPTYYYATDLWRSDGTVAGTVDLSSSLVPKPLSPSNFVETGGHVYFEAGDPRGIWRTDGTPESTVRVTTHPGNYTSISSPLVAVTGSLFYSLNVNGYGPELVRMDPDRGEITVLDMRAGAAGSAPDQLTAAGALLYFIADDGTNGRELWRSDGTVAGTFMLKNINPTATTTTSIRSLTAVGNRLFFVANDNFNGNELWTSDGTTAGTMIVADIAPGAASSSPDSLAAADGLLWFSADDGVTGRELWKSDGTAAGTQRVADLNPGSPSSTPRQLTVAARKLFFSALTAAGRELWALALNPTAYRIAGAQAVEGNSGTTQLHFKVTRIGDVSQPATILYATADGSATAGADYVAASGALSFGAGISEATIDVDVLGDTTVEATETMFVTISAPSAGIVDNALAAGKITDDDGSAALSVSYVQQGNSYGRTFVVTNTGSTAASSVLLQYTESPSVSPLSGSNCTDNGFGSIICALGSIGAGESRTIGISHGYANGQTFADNTNPPGYTITATVSTTTPEVNLADNTTTRMISNDESIALPPFLTSSTPAILDYLTGSYSYPQTIQITSSNSGVTVTPSSIVLQPGERHAAFTLQPGNITGKTKFSVGYYYSMITIPIVEPGATAKLDPLFVGSVPYYIKYGQDLEINMRVAARRADGTYPTGIVSLLDELNAIMDQYTVDAKGSVKIVKKNLPVGQFNFSLRYEGDVNVAPLQVPISFRVDPYATSIKIQSAPVICGSTAEVAVIVSTSETKTAPTGTVSVSTGSGSVQGQLVPTGQDGVARVIVQVPVTSSAYTFTASYTPSGPFSPGYQAYKSVSVGCDSAINLVATATGPARVALSWTGSAPTYEVHRYYFDTYSSGWSFLAYSGTTAFVDTSVQAGKAYLYRVRATNTSTFSAPDLATTVMFTDDPIVPMSTRIRALHFSELVTAINSVRELAGFSPASVANAPDSFVKIRQSTIADLRAALADALHWIGRPAINFTDPSLTAATTIKAVHVQELRNAVK